MSNKNLVTIDFTDKKTIPVFDYGDVLLIDGDPYMLTFVEVHDTSCGKLRTYFIFVSLIHGELFEDMFFEYDVEAEAKNCQEYSDMVDKIIYDKLNEICDWKYIGKVNMKISKV